MENVSYFSVPFSDSTVLFLELLLLFFLFYSFHKFHLFLKFTLVSFLPFELSFSKTFSKSLRQISDPLCLCFQ